VNLLHVRAGAIQLSDLPDFEGAVIPGNCVLNLLCFSYFFLVQVFTMEIVFSSVAHNLEQNKFTL
jgi:hypothetical protein